MLLKHRDFLWTIANEQKNPAQLNGISYLYSKELLLTFYHFFCGFSNGLVVQLVFFHKLVRCA